jgi:hypothetical protein
MYSFSLLLSASVLIIALSRSAFGVPLFFTELFVVAGLSLYPLFFLLGMVSPGLEGQLFLARNETPGIWVALHVFLWSIGGFLGYLAGSNLGVVGISRLSRIADKARVDQIRVFRVLVVSGLIIYCLFFYLVGWKTALANAAAGRAGIFEGFGEGASWLFLKTLAGVALLGATVYLPFVLSKKGNFSSLLSYFLLVAITYLNSISRTLLLAQVIVPIAIYLYIQPNRGRYLLQKFVIVCLLSAFATVVLLYGKGFGSLLGAFVSGADLPSLQSYQADEGIFQAFMKNVEHIWFTIGAGIDYFFQTDGALFPQAAVLAAFFGFFPSRILEFLGLGFLYHANAETIAACVNTAQFGGDTCTIPINWFGLSAYTLPIVGGLIFGFFRMYLYGGLEYAWRRSAGRSLRNAWFPYLGFTIVFGYLSMIPTVCAMMSMILVSVLLLVLCRSFIRSIVGSARRCGLSPQDFENLHPA